MAQILNTYNFEDRSRSAPKSRRRSEVRYPWAEWFDGQIRRIKPGTDFDTDPLMMERVIRTRASDRKVRVQVRHEPDGSIVFRSNVGGGQLPARSKAARRLHPPAPHAGVGVSLRMGS